MLMVFMWCCVIHKEFMDKTTLGWRILSTVHVVYSPCLFESPLLYHSDHVLVNTLVLECILILNDTL